MRSTSTGLLVYVDIPRSPWNKFIIKILYWINIDSFKWSASLYCSTISLVAKGPRAILAGSPGINRARQKITIDTPKNTITDIKTLLIKYWDVDKKGKPGFKKLN